jgi:hypothetical protein
MPSIIPTLNRSGWLYKAQSADAMGWGHPNLAVGDGESLPERKPNVIHVPFGLRLRHAGLGKNRRWFEQVRSKSQQAEMRQ